MLDSITDAGAHCASQIVLSGSHGGMLPAAIASQHNMRAVLLNDAGQGLNRAGVAGVLALDDIDMAAACASHSSCEIGSAQSMLGHGRISVANRTARQLGVEIDMPVAIALAQLQHATAANGSLPPVSEARKVMQLGELQVLLCDSASLVRPDDVDAIIIAGSHGALIGNQPARALKTQARFAAFNDAGGGLHDVGFGRLAALQQRAIAALTYSHTSAEIGNAMSAFDTGEISACNDLAQQLGAARGMPVKRFIADAFS